MAFDKEELKETAIKETKSQDLVFIEDVVVYMPCSKSTFYNYDLHELQELKDILHENKTSKKEELRKKWFDSPNATLQLALMKLLANRDELDRLNNNKGDERFDEILEKLDKIIPNYFE